MQHDVSIHTLIYLVQLTSLFDLSISDFESTRRIFSWVSWSLTTHAKRNNEHNHAFYKMYKTSPLSHTRCPSCSFTLYPLPKLLISRFWLSVCACRICEFWFVLWSTSGGGTAECWWRKSDPFNGRGGVAGVKWLRCGCTGIGGGFWKSNGGG